MDKVKELGQVMTPENIINHMIDDILRLNEVEIQTLYFYYRTY